MQVHANFIYSVMKANDSFLDYREERREMRLLPLETTTQLAPIDISISLIENIWTEVRRDRSRERNQQKDL